MEYFLHIQNAAQVRKLFPTIASDILDNSPIDQFPHIQELGKQKYDVVLPDSMHLHSHDGIEIHFVHKGRYEWIVDDKSYTLFPGDVFITFPWQKHGSHGGRIDLGLLSWVIIKPEVLSKDLGFKTGKWSGLTEKEQKQIEKIFLKSSKQCFRNEKIGLLFAELVQEFDEKELGYTTRVNAMIDQIIVLCARSMQALDDEERSMPPEFAKLINAMKKDIAHAWSVEEMSEMVSMKVTAFNEKMKKITGYTPADYLIMLRLSKAKELLKETSDRITDIAEICGFYSVQHLSDTFKKRVGVTPKDFRKMQ